MADLFATGADEIDLDRAASTFPDISLDDEGGIAASQLPSARYTTTSATGFSFDDFDASAQSDNKAPNEELDKFQNEFPEISFQQTPIAPPAQHTGPLAPRPQPSTYSSTPIFNAAAEQEEPQVIKDWRERQQREIEARDTASKARKQEAISKAERAIDEFYEDYAKRKERNIRENKDQEAEYVASLTASLSTGTTWERICDLIELQNSQSKTIARTGRTTTDLSRFKEVLLRLKREGTAAPGAGGY